MPVMSVRLTDKEEDLIKALAKEENKEKSSEARELIMEGLRYRMLLGHKQGKLSLGMLSKKLGLSLAESLDLLALLGLPSPVRYDDYLQSLDVARKAVK